LKCHKETPYLAILSKIKCHFFSFTKMENMRAKQTLSGGIGIPGRREDVGKGVGE
jgi:hypothetical protein